MSKHPLQRRASPRSQTHTLVAVGGLIILCLFYLTFMLRTAWLSDDSFISIRQVVNFTHGYGLTWNPGQRVQAFTHPAWFFLLSLCTKMTGEYLMTTLVVSLVVSLAAIVILFWGMKPRRNFSRAILLIVFLSSSTAFIDYSTSGLENPLSHFLLAILLVMGARNRPWTETTSSLFFTLAALLVLNRQDLALLVGPLALYLWIQKLQLQVKPLLPGICLLCGWFLFSGFYFGSFVPNTYAAKVGAGFPLSERLMRGFNYFYVQWLTDPMTLVMIAWGIIAGFKRKQRAGALAFGLLLYLLYVLEIGGDFMQGRFFAAPFLVALFLVLTNPLRFYFFSRSAIAALLALAFLTSPLFPIPSLDYANKGWIHAIADERGYYFQRYGLLVKNRRWPKIATPSSLAPKTVIAMCGGLGRTGLSDDGSRWIIDKCALTDPFLSRLPAIQNPQWRIGHHWRKLPTNYVDVLLRPDRPLRDTQLTQLHRDIDQVTRKPLWTASRFLSLKRLLFTRPYVINTEPYRNSRVDIRGSDHPKEVGFSHISQVPKLKGHRWNAPGNTRFGWNGIRVTFGQTRSIEGLELSLDNNDTILLEFFKGNEMVDQARINKASHKVKRGGLVPHQISLKKSVEVDSIVFAVVGGDGFCSLGHLILKDSPTEKIIKEL
jgi:arabinofuranosyltransferase